MKSILLLLGFLIILNEIDFILTRVLKLLLLKSVCNVIGKSQQKKNLD